jgi:hypothetical protein
MRRQAGRETPRLAVALLHADTRVLLLRFANRAG